MWLEKARDICYGPVSCHLCQNHCHCGDPVGAENKHGDTSDFVHSVSASGDTSLLLLSFPLSLLSKLVASASTEAGWPGALRMEASEPLLQGPLFPWLWEPWVLVSHWRSPGLHIL